MSENDILTETYNLILNPTITEAERAILRRFKDQVCPNKDMTPLITHLAEDLRKLAVKNISQQTHLSKEVAELYQKIAYTAKQNQEMGRGLSSLGVTLSGLRF
ncbi:bacteriocin immunity protein [Streptococcus pneumoniae]